MRVEPVCAIGVVRVASERSSGGGTWCSAGGASRLSGLVLLGCLLAFNGWAQSSTATSREAAKINQRVTQHQAEVQRLQHDVSQQESASQQAAQKLQQQDQAIAELRKQIEAAQQSSKTPPAKH
jgi:septal ring factor EnvC (AmiA/AmiB activator)